MSNRTPALIGLTIVPALLAAPVPAQITSSGNRAIIIGVNNGRIVIVGGASNARLNAIAADLQQIKKNNSLSATELSKLIELINREVVPAVMNIEKQTAALTERVNKLEARVNIAASDPDAARAALRPYLDPAINLTNARRSINEFLDYNGQSTYRLTFKVTGNCQLFHEASQTINFHVAYQILSDRGTPIFGTMRGIQPKYPPIPLTTGTYQVLITVRGGAGQYRLDLATRCE